MTGMARQGSCTGSRFEALLGDVAAHFLGVALEDMHQAIDNALARLVEFLEVDRATIRLIDPADGAMRVAHSVAPPGIERPPLGLAGSDVPWLTRLIGEAREPIIFSSVSDLPPEAAAHLRMSHGSGVKSAAVFPIVAGVQVLGSLSFATAGEERSWEPDVVDRLRLISQVFAGAFARLEHGRKLRATLAEVDALRERLQAENEYLRERTYTVEGFADIVGESAALRRVLFQAEQVASTDATVLLLGETGTGKELMAKAIHAKSHRRHRTLVRVNCAALPPTLIESELFGHERGAFTGAVSRKIGRFELADQGTLFLDEVGELPLGLQAKLLRVLQEGEFERLGSSATHKVDVRIIAASNRDLRGEVRDGSFRSDLYYRLGVFPIEIPPLRARKDDIPLLVWHTLAKLGSTLGRKIERIPAATMEHLVRYDWPGNIRELRNVLERAVILSPGSTLLLDELSEAKPMPVVAASPPGAVALADVERDHILSILERCGWRVRGARNAAEQLGLNASTLYSRMKKLGIRRAASRASPGSGARPR